MVKEYKIGDINFSNPILNASGCWCYNEEQLTNLYNSNLGGIVDTALGDVSDIETVNLMIEKIINLSIKILIFGGIFGLVSGIDVMLQLLFIR